MKYLCAMVYKLPFFAELVYWSCKTSLDNNDENFWVSKCMIVECFLLYNVKKMLSKCICWEPRVIVIFFFILFLVSKVSAIVILYTIIIIHLPLFGFFFYNKCFFAICKKSFFILSFGFVLLTNYWNTLTRFKLIIFFQKNRYHFLLCLCGVYGIR